jgi:hypothetical protein
MANDGICSLHLHYQLFKIIIYFSNRYGLKTQHLQIFLGDRKVCREKYVAKYVVTFVVMNHSGQFIYIFHTKLSKNMLHWLECNEVVDLVDSCCKIYLVISNNS